MDKKNMPIGVMDSGLGGLSILRAARKVMPNENFIYYGDSLHAPYGTKSVEEVAYYTEEVTKYLLKLGIKEMIIACNTATSAAINMLRENYNFLPIIGVEPALKPAVKNNDGGIVGVLATPTTLRETKFHNLIECYHNQATIIPVPCDGLMEYVEQGILDGPELTSYLTKRLRPFIHQNNCTLVLGCTHYPFVKETISTIVGPEVSIIDGSMGTAKEALHQLRIHNLETSRNKPGAITILNSSKDPSMITRSNALLQLP